MFALDVEKVQGVKVYDRWMLLAGHVVVKRVNGENKVCIDSYIHVPHDQVSNYLTFYSHLTR